jgi:His-Xaa-Ser system radical SAM maturase HxsB
MNTDDLDAACDAVFLSPSPTLTVEFQGGDPLLRFDLVQRAILRIEQQNRQEGRNIRFVVASTLHQLTPSMCDFFKRHSVYLSTSIDGPASLHNRNRPTKARDAYERTLAGVQLARELIGQNSVSALMTTTRASLPHAADIVDEYVRLGLPEVFIRPLSSYGFAKRNQQTMAYDLGAFMEFYSQTFERVLWWNGKGIAIREVYASIIFNKILSTFDAGYVDLQSPTGAGTSVVAYNYDGYIYPSDEARMLAETGDVSLRMGRIQDAENVLTYSPLVNELREASTPDALAGCDTCAYHRFCGPNPVDAVAQHGSMFAPVNSTEHCQRHMALFDFMFMRLKRASELEKDIFYRWAQPAQQEEASCGI